MTDENKDEPKKPWDDLIKYEFETARKKEKIYLETVKWMETDDDVQAWLSGFQQATIAQQISNYAWRKAGWLVGRERTEWALEYTLLEYKNKAQKCLGNIQQKKLFNKQCEWRAGQFTHPAIETTRDFLYWEYNILNCPFLDPISTEDIELYLEYLRTYFGENLPFLGRWQDYDSYNSDHTTTIKMMNPPTKDEDEEGGDDWDDTEEDEEEPRLMPPWYAFCDERRGEGHYLLLPDVKRDIELSYSSLGYKDYIANLTPEQITNPPGAPPFLNLYSEDKLESFIEDFEKNPKEIFNAYETYKKLNTPQGSEKMERVRTAWEDLLDCYDPFPMAEGASWQEALIETAKRWKNHKIAAMIPSVYDEYLFRQENGISHPFDDKQAASYLALAQQHKAWILKGRELRGEPQDLNF